MRYDMYLYKKYETHTTSFLCFTIIFKLITAQIYIYSKHDFADNASNGTSDLPIIPAG